VWLPLVIGVGVAAALLLAFWAEVQNWLAGVVDRAHRLLGRSTYTVQSALVLLDRIMVNGRRMIQLAGRTVLIEKATRTVITTEEVQQLERDILPGEILAKLDAGQPISYEISDASNKK
jgi:DNA-binding transcriptional regulator YdaS (Cro superfamily)